MPSQRRIGPAGGRGRTRRKIGITTVGPETTIQKTTEISLEDLIEGMRLTVSGERGEDGTVEATTIFVQPEGAGSFAGGGFRGGFGHDEGSVGGP